MIVGSTIAFPKPQPTDKGIVLSPETATWSQIGHRVVGDIAQSYLTRKTKRRIKKVLGTESVAMSSNWADFIKSDTAMSYLDSWHYINIKGGFDTLQFKVYLSQDTAVDAYTKLNFLLDELKKPSLSQEKKAFYVRFLIHLVGDIHQPMHVSHKEDLGGNKVMVSWFNEPTNLHAVWDEKLIMYQKLSYTEYSTSINYTTKVQRRIWQQQPISDWFYESYKLADHVYAGITQPNQKLSYRYNYDNIDIVNQQLLKGGVRLAGILNDLFK